MKVPGGVPSPADERVGRRAAWVLFAVFAAAELVFAMRPGPPGELGPEADLFVRDVMLVLAAPVLALAVHFVLPRAARRAFWSTGLLCMGLTVLLWGVTCGVKIYRDGPTHSGSEEAPGP